MGYKNDFDTQGDVRSKGYSHEFLIGKRQLSSSSMPNPGDETDWAKIVKVLSICSVPLFVSKHTIPFCLSWVFVYTYKLLCHIELWTTTFPVLKGSVWHWVRWRILSGVILSCFYSTWVLPWMARLGCKSVHRSFSARYVLVLRSEKADVEKRFPPPLPFM